MELDFGAAFAGLASDPRAQCLVTLWDHTCKAEATRVGSRSPYGTLQQGCLQDTRSLQWVHSAKSAGGLVFSRGPLGRGLLSFGNTACILKGDLEIPKGCQESVSGPGRSSQAKG